MTRSSTGAPVRVRPPGSGARALSPATSPATSSAAEALAGLPQGWTVLNDVRRPGRTGARVAHVVVGPGGVFVVDTVSWPGRVEARERVRRRDGRRLERRARATRTAAEHVSGMLPGLGANLVRPVLCVEDGAPVSAVSGGVVVCSPHNLVELLTTRSAALAAEPVRETVQALHSRVASGPVARRRRLPPVPPVLARLARAGWRLALAAAVVVAIGYGVQHRQQVLDRLDAIVHASHDEVGSTLSLPATREHPALEVTVRRVAEVSALGAAHHGRLVGVQVVVADVGRRPLRLDTADAATLRPVLGRSYAATPTWLPIREGRLLPPRLEVAAGRTVRGWLVFRVAPEARFDQVVVRFGSLHEDVARWTIPRADRSPGGAG